MFVRPFRSSPRRREFLPIIIKGLGPGPPPLAGALLGRCGCCGRRGVGGAKAAPVCHGWMPWEGCPAAGGFVWLLPMRARTRSTSCAPCTACDKHSALRWLSFAQFRCRVARCDWRLADESERSRGMACAEASSGRGASPPGSAQGGRASRAVTRRRRCYG